MSTNLAKKFFASALAASTVLMAMPLVASAHGIDSLVKSSDNTIWFITTEGSQTVRRPFSSYGAFQSYGFMSLANVADVDAQDLAYPVGSIIPPQDGKVFCATETKGTDVKNECALITGGQKASFTSAAVFTGLGYSFSKAFYGDSSFLTKTSNIDNSTAAHRAGQLVNNGGTIQLIGPATLLGIPSVDVFNSYGFSFSKDVVPANAADKAYPQTAVMVGRAPGQLSPSFTTTPTPSGAYSATLASDSPAAGTLVATQATADLAHFMINGTGTITSLKFKRIGVSADATLSNAYLFEGATRLTDSASVSSGNITFAGLNWQVNGSRALALKSDILTGTSGQTVGVQLVAINGVDLASQPSGAIHTIATATLTTVVLGASPTGTFTDPGKDITVFQSSVTVGTRDVTLNRLALRQTGSISSTDINNFRLMIDGVQAGNSVALDSNGFVTFAPNVLMKSGSRVVRVMADVVGGSSRTVQMSLRGAYDVTSTDSQYNVNVLATLASGSFPYGPSASTVASGTVSVVKASDSQSANVIAGASDVSVAKYTFTAYGETVKIETLTVSIDTNGTDANNSFRNVRILVDGAQVGSTTSVAAANSFVSGTSFSTNFYVTPGTPRTVEIRSDMYDDTPTDLIGAGTTTSAQFALFAGSSNATPQTSLTPISVPTTTTNANALTISTGTMTLASNPVYPNQNIVSPLTAYKIGSFNLSGNSSEAININTFTVDMTTVDAGAGATLTVADITDVYVKYGASQTTTKATISATGNTYSVNIPLAINGNMQVDVYGTIGSDFLVNDTIKSKLLVSGTTATSGQSSSTNSGSTLDGQTHTGVAASITASLDASSPVAALVDDSGTVTTGTFKFVSLTDSYTVTDLTISIAACTTVSNVALVSGATTINKPCATSITFSGLSIPIAANATVLAHIDLTMSTIGVGAGSTDSSLATAITAFTARNSAGTSAAGTVGSATGNAMYAYKAIPTVSTVALPNSALSGGEMVIAKFTVSSGGTGTIAWKQVMFEITKAAAPTLSAATLYNSDTATQITAASVYQNGTGGVATTCVADNTFCELLITVGTNANDDVVETVSGAKTYEIRSTVGGTLASGNFVSVKLDRNTAAHAASGLEQAVDNSLAAGNVSFVWSDESASATNDTGVASWQTDYLVKNLPVTWNLNRS